MLSRVVLTAAFALVCGLGIAQEKKEKKDESRKGTVTGVVTAKGPTWIEVTADGEEKGRRYVPHWTGGLPKDGGGPDKEMVAKIKDTPLKSRVRIEWEFEERARVIKIDVLKKPDGKGSTAKEAIRHITGEIKSEEE